MYLELLRNLATKLMQGMRKLFKVYKMETHKGNKDLVTNAKVKSRTMDILMKFKPFRFQIKRELIYDSYKKISIVTNDVSIILDEKDNER